MVGNVLGEIFLSSYHTQVIGTINHYYRQDVHDVIKDLLGALFMNHWAASNIYGRYLLKLRFSTKEFLQVNLFNDNVGQKQNRIQSSTN